MQSRPEPLFLNEREWTWVSVQSPLGAVTLARKLPTVSSRAAQTRRALVISISRRFALSSRQDSATKRPRSRRLP